MCSWTAPGQGMYVGRLVIYGNGQTDREKESPSNGPWRPLDVKAYRIAAVVAHILERLSHSVGNADGSVLQKDVSWVDVPGWVVTRRLDLSAQGSHLGVRRNSHRRINDRAVVDFFEGHPLGELPLCTAGPRRGGPLNAAQHVGGLTHATVPPCRTRHSADRGAKECGANANQRVAASCRWRVRSQPGHHNGQKGQSDATRDPAFHGGHRSGGRAKRVRMHLAASGGPPVTQRSM
mmetsp:Transcript_32983/g.81688  ORF Transcript_32983/g.81688 Transcript_32983/m.81688 type:complete len:235 (-) Transcript_32983:57-761(-)